MTTFIEQVYEQIADIRYISTDEFSRNYLDKNPSYYRSIKSRHIAPSTGALICLLETIGKQMCIIKSGNTHPFMYSVAQRYEDLGIKVCEEIAKRISKKPICSVWTQEILTSVIYDANACYGNSKFKVGSPIIIY